MHLAEEIRYLLLAAQREGNRYFAEALRPLALSPAQAEVLRVLQDFQPISLRDLGKLLVCEHGSPSRLVDGLVSAGLVLRIPSQHDGRSVTLTLTGQGKERAEQVMELIQSIPVQEVMEMFWRYIAGRPAGNALARRVGRETQG